MQEKINNEIYIRLFKIYENINISILKQLLCNPCVTVAIGNNYVD